VRVLAWIGMPATEGLAEVASRVGEEITVVTISSNEHLEAQLSVDEPFDLIFPSDYLVERLRRRDLLLELGPVPLDRLEPWALTAEHDPGCHHSVPFAYGTTGILRGPRAAGLSSWRALFTPSPGVAVGMLDEVREVIGAALMATGHSPNDCDEAALGDARALLLAQRPNVSAYDSDDFCEPVRSGRVVAHQAWSGPAAQAARGDGGLSYVVPDEGAVLWVTTAAIPVDAPHPERSLRVLSELMDPALAALTTARNGYATPNRPARALLPAALRDDPALFPDSRTRARCHALRDLGAGESRMLDVWSAAMVAPGPPA
jgi:spermidine/putrescine transport system substrate-binding protein